MDKSVRLLPYVVTGFAKCGELTLRQVLIRAGLTLPGVPLFGAHGDDGALRIREQYLDANCDVSWAAAPFLRSCLLLKQSCIIHLMRNPWAVLRSLIDDPSIFQTKDGLGERACVDLLIEKTLPSVFHYKRDEDRVAHYLVGWDALLRQKYATRSVICHRIEDSYNHLLARMRDVQRSEKWGQFFPPIEINDVEDQPGVGVVPHPDDFRLEPRLKYELFCMADRWGYL